MIKLNSYHQEHYDLALRTANVIKYIYQQKCTGNKITSDKIYALCLLSWGSPRDLIKIKALWILWDKSGTPPSKDDIEILTEFGFPSSIMKYAREWTGLVNFYKAYRKTSRVWIKKNYKKILPLLRKASTLKSNDETIKLAKEIEKLPGIPKGNNKPGKMAASSLLTPLFAFLDPRMQFPLINKADHVTTLQKKLKIIGNSLGDKVEILLGLINQYGLKNAFMLDALSSKLAKMKLHIDLEDFKKPEYAKTKLLGLKDDNDIKVIVKKRSKKAVLLHNSMTNQLLKLCKVKNYEVHEGKEPYKFDALVLNYNNKGRDLLIEAKSSVDRSHLRLAVGQLLDYRRGLKRRLVTDLSVLFPRKPAKKELLYLQDVGIAAIWFKNIYLTKIAENSLIKF